MFTDISNSSSKAPPSPSLCQFGLPPVTGIVRGIMVQSGIRYSLGYGKMGYGKVLIVASLGYGTVLIKVQSWLWRACVVANLGCAEFGLCWSLGCGRVWLVAVWVVAVWVMASLGCGSLGNVVASTIHHVFRHQADSTTE